MCGFFPVLTLATSCAASYGRDYRQLLFRPPKRGEQQQCEGNVVCLEAIQSCFCHCCQEGRQEILNLHILKACGKEMGATNFWGTAAAIVSHLSLDVKSGLGSVLRNK